MTLGAPIRSGIYPYSTAERGATGLSRPHFSRRSTQQPMRMKNGVSYTTLTDLADVQQVFALTDQFCSEHLLAEYAGLCRELLARLSRSRTARR